MARWGVDSNSDGGRARAVTVAGREGSTIVGRGEREDGGREGENLPGRMIGDRRGRTVVGDRGGRKILTTATAWGDQEVYFELGPYFKVFFLIKKYVVTKSIRC